MRRINSHGKIRNKNYSQDDKNSDVEAFHLRYVFGLTELGMRMTGIWPMDNRYSNFKFTTCSLALNFMAITCVFGLFSTRDIEPFIECLLYFIVTFFTFLKLLLVKFKQKKFRIVLRDIAKDSEMNSALPDNSVSKDRVAKNIKTIKLITMMLGVFLCISVTAFFIQSYNSKTHTFELSSFPFFTFLPEEVKDTVYFYMLFGCIGFGFIVWTLVIVSIDSAFVIFTVHATNRFVFLYEKLKMYDDTDSHTSNNKVNPLLQPCNCIKCIIRHHVTTVRFIKKVERAFSCILLVELTRNVLHFGIQINNLIWFYKINSILKFVHIAIILFSMNLHLFLYCAAAKHLTEAGVYVSTCAFKLRWYRFRFKTIQSLMLLILSAQRPCYISAGKCINPSLETYTNILATSCSYASVITAVRQA